MSTSFKAVITSDRYSQDVTSFDRERELLERFPDIQVDLSSEPIRTEEDMVRLGNSVDALFLSTRNPVTRSACEQMNRVRVIARYGVGLDNVDLDAAADHDIVVTHYPQYCTNEVADHATTMMLTLNRRIVQLNADLHDGAWTAHGALTRSILRGPVPPLRETTVGLIAMGRIGEMVTARMRSFGCRVIASDPFLTDDEVRARGAEPVDFATLLESADMISIHCPLTPETRGLLGPEQFARMKTNVIVVNTARGPIINQAALYDFMAANPQAQAGLDVFEVEPLPTDSPLFSLPNIVLTPHSAYYSERSTQIVRDETFLSAVSVLRGFLPPVVANPAVLERVELREEGA